VILIPSRVFKYLRYVPYRLRPIAVSSTSGTESSGQRLPGPSPSSRLYNEICGAPEDSELKGPFRSAPGPAPTIQSAVSHFATVLDYCITHCTSTVPYGRRLLAVAALGSVLTNPLRDRPGRVRVLVGLESWRRVVSPKAHEGAGGAKMGRVDETETSRPERRKSGCGASGVTRAYERGTSEVRRTELRVCGNRIRGDEAGLTG
jgi:hypothetical protein